MGFPRSCQLWGLRRVVACGLGLVPMSDLRAARACRSRPCQSPHEWIVGLLPCGGDYVDAGWLRVIARLAQWRANLST